MRRIQGAQIVQLISDYREMLARRRQRAHSATVTLDDSQQSAADVHTPTTHDPPSPPPTSRRSLHATAMSGVPVTSSVTSSMTSSRRGRVGAGRYAAQHHRRRSPTSSPELDASSQSTSATGARSTAGKTQLKYKRVKDTVRQPQKRAGHVLVSHKSDTRQEGIFD